MADLGVNVHVVAYGFLKMAEAARTLTTALETLGLSLALGEAYNPRIVADFERDSGMSIEEIERLEESMGVSMP